MRIERLLLGNRSFMVNSAQKLRWYLDDQVKNGQKPVALYIGCSDSRAEPAIFLEAGIGDIFVTRNIGNFVPPFDPEAPYNATASAIEYAVSALEVPHIVVCAHTHCGAIATLYKNIEGEEFAAAKVWLKQGEAAKLEAIDMVGEEDQQRLLRATEKISLLKQIENLKTYPGVRRRLDEGSLNLHAWVYHIEDGSLEIYDFERKEFVQGGGDED